MSRVFKFKVWDEKHRQWDTCADGGHFCLYPNVPLVDQGRVYVPFTNFKDKKGREIYDGDILQEDENDHLLTVHQQPSGLWVAQAATGYVEMLVNIDKKVTVVGNIYEKEQIRN